MTEAVKLLKQTTVYQRFFRVDELQLQIEKFEGGWLPEMTREVFRIGRATVGLLYDPRRDQIVLIEQFRPAPYLYGQNPFIFECIAGLLDGDETPEAALRRETVEEAGCTPKRIEMIGEFFSSPGAVDEFYTVFVAEIDAAEAHGIHGLAEEHENIRVHVMPASEAVALLDAGKIVNSPAVVALQWFARHGEGLRQRWLAD